jgi:hypothetical protein
MLQDDTGDTFMVNSQHLKVFLEPENLEKIDVIEFCNLMIQSRKFNPVLISF